MLADKKIKFRTAVLLAISFLIFILDQLTKYLCNTYLNYGEPVTLFPGFDLLLVYNSGEAFSFLNDAGGWQRWFLTTFSSVISLLLIFWIIKLPKEEKLSAIALCFILGGALGNLYDRVINGYVIDFISLYYKSFYFATFNIADSAVFIGACLMALDIFRNRPDPTHLAENKDSNVSKSHDGSYK